MTALMAALEQLINALNGATNLIGFALVILGALAEIKHPGSGTAIVTGAFGLLTGKAITNAARRASDFNGGNGHGKETNGAGKPGAPTAPNGVS